MNINIRKNEKGKIPIPKEEPIQLTKDKDEINTQLQSIRLEGRKLVSEFEKDKERVLRKKDEFTRKIQIEVGDIYEFEDANTTFGNGTTRLFHDDTITVYVTYISHDLEITYMTLTGTNPSTMTLNLARFRNRINKYVGNAMLLLETMEKNKMQGFYQNERPNIDEQPF